MMIQVVNKVTGEVIELEDNNATAVRDSWRMITETIKALERAKDKLKPKVNDLLAEQTIFPIGDYQFRRTISERKTYDKAVMREVFKDEDLLDTFLMPDKTSIDDYLKVHLEELGDGSTRLRESMVPVMTRDKKTGEKKPMAPIVSIRLERLS